MSAFHDLNRADVFREYTELATQTGAINLAQGIPEPLNHDSINRELIAELKQGWNYTNPWGLVELRQVVSTLYLDDFDPKDVLITSGCTESLYVGLRGLGFNYGNKVAFFEPFYPYYPGIVQLIGLEPVPIPMRWKQGIAVLDWDALEAAMRKGVQILILNTPHNPTGWMLSNDEAIMLRSLSKKYGTFILIDEAYKHFVYDDAFATSTRLLYQENERCLLAGSTSKLLSATGLRIGWLLGSEDVLQASYAVHLYTSYCQPAPLQKVAATLLTQQEKAFSQTVKERYSSKRNLLLAALKRIGLTCEPPAGGHFLLADYTDICSDDPPGIFAKHFAAKYGVMPLPADPFYMQSFPRQIRFSFAVSPAIIEQAVSRLN